MVYTYHPRSTRPATRQRLLEEYDRNAASRLRMIEAMAAQRGLVDSQLPMAPQPIEPDWSLPPAAGRRGGALRYSGMGPLPLPYGQGDANLTDEQKAEEWKRKRQFIYDWAGQEVKSRYDREQAEYDARLDAEKLEKEQEYEVQLANMSAAKQQGYLDAMMEAEEFRQTGRMTLGQQELQDEFDKARMEEVQEGFRSGRYKFTPEQKKELAQIDQAIGQAHTSPRLNEQQRAQLLSGLYQKRKNVWLNPTETAPDEQKVSLADDFKQNTHKDEDGRVWVKDKDGGWQVARGWSEMKGGPTVTDPKTAEVMKRTGLDAAGLGKERAELRTKMNREITDYMKIPTRVKEVTDKDGVETKKWVDGPAPTLDEARKVVEQHNQPMLEWYGMVPWAIDEIPREDRERVIEEGMDLEFGDPRQYQGPVQIPPDDPDRPGSSLMDEIRTLNAPEPPPSDEAVARAWRTLHKLKPKRNLTADDREAGIQATRIIEEYRAAMEGEQPEAAALPPEPPPAEGVYDILEGQGVGTPVMAPRAAETQPDPPHVTMAEQILTQWMGKTVPPEELERVKWATKILMEHEASK